MVNIHQIIDSFFIGSVAVSLFMINIDLSNIKRKLDNSVEDINNKIGRTHMYLNRNMNENESNIVMAISDLKKSMSNTETGSLNDKFNSLGAFKKDKDYFFSSQKCKEELSKNGLKYDHLKWIDETDGKRVIRINNPISGITENNTEVIEKWCIERERK